MRYDRLRKPAAWSVGVPYGLAHQTLRSDFSRGYLLTLLPRTLRFPPVIPRLPSRLLDVNLELSTPSRHPGSSVSLIRGSFLPSFEFRGL